MIPTQDSLTEVDRVLQVLTGQYAGFYNAPGEAIRNAFALALDQARKEERRLALKDAAKVVMNLPVPVNAINSPLLTEAAGAIFDLHDACSR